MPKKETEESKEPEEPVDIIDDSFIPFVGSGHR